MSRASQINWIHLHRIYKTQVMFIYIILIPCGKRFFIFYLLVQWLIFHLDMVQKMFGYNCAKGLGQTLPYSASNRFKVTSKFLEKKTMK